MAATQALRYLSHISKSGKSVFLHPEKDIYDGHAMQTIQQM